jgi:Na+/melibiose symporter-like transporter
VPLTAVGVIAIFFLVPESKSPSPGRIDYLGVLLSIAGLVLVVYGIIRGGDTGSWAGADVLGPIVGGLAVLAVFGWHESRTEHPSLDVRLFRDPRLSTAAAAIALVFFAMSGVYFFISFYMQNVRGYAPLQAGLLTIPLAAGQLLFSTRSAVLVRRFGMKVVCTCGLLVVALALVGYHFLGTSTPIGMLEVIFFVQGAGMGTVMPTATEAVMSVVPRSRGGAGSAITNTSRQVAVALGVAVLGSILATAYRLHLTPHLAALPQGLRGQATQSIAATQAIAQHLGPAGAGLLTAANASFVHAMHVTSLISVGIAVLGAAAMAIWMPGRPAAASAGTVSAGTVSVGMAGASMAGASMAGPGSAGASAGPAGPVLAGRPAESGG